MKKTIFSAGILCPGIICLALLIAACSEPYIDKDKIYTITFYHDNAYYDNNGFMDSAKTSLETDVKGRLSRLPPPPVKQDDLENGNTIRSYAFTGWFTTGGTEVSLKTVFQADTLVVARWRASDEVDKDEPGPLADQLAFWQNSAPQASRSFTVNADETIKAQVLDFEGQQVTVKLSGSLGLEISPSLVLSGFGALFTVENGVTLELENLRLQGKRNTSSLIVVNSGGKLIIKDGTIITSNGNENKEFGGAVTVNIGGTFEMTGGLLTNNYSYDPLEDFFTASAGGGGVLVRGGTFTMTGGLITENEGGNGGGVLVNRGGKFTMDEDAQIHKNYANEGGGVKIVGAINTGDKDSPRGSTFIMKKGTISENTALGGGVAVGFRGIFILEEGGKISKNLGSDAGGVYNGLGTVYMYGGEISENRGPWSAGGVMNQGEFYMYGGSITKNFGGLGGGVSNFLPPVLGLGGWFHMWDGEISDNTGDGSGGGVVNDAFFYMHGGKISGNKTNAGMGGGVYNGNPGYEDDGIFIITGGTVYGNGDKQEPQVPNTSLDNIDRGGGSQGGAFYILGGTVAWGRRGYYDLDGSGNLRFNPDTRYEDGLSNPGKEMRGRQFIPDITIGKPKKIEIDSDGKGNMVYTTDMDHDFAKQKTSSNNTIEVKPNDGVYINGAREVNFFDLIDF